MLHFKVLQTNVKYSLCRSFLESCASIINQSIRQYKQNEINIFDYESEWICPSTVPVAFI